MGRPGFAQQTVEAFCVLGVHQHVHGDLLTDLGQRTADFEVAQVCAYQHLPALAAQLPTHLRGVVDFDLFDAQLAVPHVELVEQGVGEGHELPEHTCVAGPQRSAPAPVGQALLVFPGTPACRAAEQEEVQHDAVQHRA